MPDRNPSDDVVLGVPGSLNLRRQAPVDPLAQSAAAWLDIVDDSRPPDATGDTDAITNLRGLDRHESEPGATWYIEPTPEDDR